MLCLAAHPDEAELERLNIPAGKSAGCGAFNLESAGLPGIGFQRLAAVRAVRK